MNKTKDAFLAFLKEVETTAVAMFRLLSSEKGYGSLFKAGVVLVSASMIAISQTGSIVYDSDLASHREKFEIEVVLKGELKNASQCFSLPDAHVAKCRSAVYGLAQVESAWDLSLKVFTLFFQLGAALLVIATIGFVVGVPKPGAKAKR